MSIAAKTEWINDKQGKGLLDLAEGSLTEYGSPITVEVTEPLRFFFCCFLSECAAGLFLLSVVAPRPLHLDFYIFKNSDWTLNSKRSRISLRIYWTRLRKRNCKSGCFVLPLTHGQGRG